MVEKILIITPVPIIPSHAGNKKRIHSICTELMNQGYELDLFYTGFDESLNSGHEMFINGTILNHRVSPVPVKFMMDPLLRSQELINGFWINIERIKRYLIGGSESFLYNKSVYQYKNLQKLMLLKKQIQGVRYNTVIINYAVYSFYFKLFNRNVRKIVDIHDRLTNRFKIFLDRGEIPVNWYSLTYHDEKKALKVADIVWAITAEEKNHYQKMLKDSEVSVETLRHITNFKYIPANNGKKNVLMIGSDNKLNRDGLSWFFDKIWPMVYSKFPDSQLIVAGSICNCRDSFYDTQGVTFYGRFELETDMYKMSDICINPMLEGTGLKIKTFEALSYGKRVLSTKEGASGLTDLIGMGLFCSDHPDEWIDEFERIFDNQISNDEFLSSLEHRLQEIHDHNVNVLKKSLS